MTTGNRVQYSLIIASGLTTAFLTSILYVELRWSLNLFTLIVPWLAVSGLMLALAVRPKPWPFLPRIAALLCIFQLGFSQVVRASLESLRQSHSAGMADPVSYFISGIEGNDPDGYDGFGGGMKALPSLGLKGYVPFLANLLLWTLSVFGTRVAVRKLNANFCYGRRTPVYLTMPESTRAKIPPPRNR